jgi:hypothetical protein
MQPHKAMVAPRKVLRTRYVTIENVRWAYQDDLECGHPWRYERRRRGPTAKIRDCVECQAKAVQLRDRREVAHAPVARVARAGPSPEVSLLRAALKRLILSTSTSPAPAAVRRFAYEALQVKTSEEALLYVDALQRLGEVVVEFLNGHPYGEKAMALREEMDRLCRVAGLIDPPEVEPEADGDPPVYRPQRRLTHEEA